jgi:hypothetical protein
MDIFIILYSPEQVGKLFPVIPHAGSRKTWDNSGIILHSAQTKLKESEWVAPLLDLAMDWKR